MPHQLPLHHTYTCSLYFLPIELILTPKIQKTSKIVNYGRFWAYLGTLLIRPFDLGPNGFSFPRWLFFCQFFFFVSRRLKNPTLPWREQLWKRGRWPLNLAQTMSDNLYISEKDKFLLSALLFYLQNKIKNIPNDDTASTCCKFYQ